MPMKPFIFDNPSFRWTSTPPPPSNHQTILKWFNGLYNETIFIGFKGGGGVVPVLPIHYFIGPLHTPPQTIKPFLNGLLETI